MLKHRSPIPPVLFSLLAATACHRLPLSLGEGFDDAVGGPRDSSGNAGSSSGGGGNPGTAGAGGSTSGGVGGASGYTFCEQSYLDCIERGESRDLCSEAVVGCFDPGAAGTTGAGGFAGETGAGTAGYGAGGYGTAGYGATGGFGGTGGAPSDSSAGAGGAPEIDPCYATYLMCLESGESRDVCHDDWDRCYADQSGSAGAGGIAGAGGAPAGD